MLTLALVVFFFLPIQEVILAEVTSTYFFYFYQTLKFLLPVLFLSYEGF